MISPRKKTQGIQRSIKGNKKNDKFDRMGKIDREQESRHDDSQEAMEGEPDQGRFQEGHVIEQLPIAAYLPSTGIM